MVTKLKLFLDFLEKEDGGAGTVITSTDTGFFAPTYGGGVRKKNPYTVDGNKMDWLDKDFGTAVSAWHRYYDKPRLPTGEEEEDFELNKRYLKAIEYFLKAPKMPSTPTTLTTPKAGATVAGTGKAAGGAKGQKSCPPGMHSHEPMDSAATANCHMITTRHQAGLVARGAHKPLGAEGKEVDEQGRDAPPPETEEGTIPKGATTGPTSGYSVSQYEWREASEDDDEFAGYKINKKPDTRTYLNVDYENSDDPAAFEGAVMLTVGKSGAPTYNYTEEQLGRKKAAKFNRQGSFITDIEVARTTINKDVEDDVDEAAIVYMMEQTGFRIGRPGTKSKKKGAKVTSEDFDEKGEKVTYGASTILNKHVNIDGDDVIFNFPSKGGVQIPDKTITDPTLAKILGNRVDRNRPEEPIFKSDHRQTREYLKRTIGRDYILHDIRTMKATEKALEHIKTQELPTSKDEFDNLVRSTADFVSDFLHNEPHVAMGTYVNHAAVFGSMMQQLGIESVQYSKGKGKEKGVSVERTRKPKETAGAVPAAAPETQQQQSVPAQQQAPQQLPPDVPKAPSGVSKETKMQIKHHFDSGMSIKEIAKKLEMPFEVVKPIIQRISAQYEAKDYPTI